VRDTRFGRIGDAFSGTLICKWPGCGAEIYTEAVREDQVADDHWNCHEASPDPKVSD
jgi:hypothetical protein